jgi:nitrite reductase/ring-hydroxylating ferredoxin subunit
MALQKLNITLDRLKEGMVTGEEVNGKMLVVLMLQGRVYALDAVCTHEGGPLNEGSIDGNEIICPWHSGAYNIATGKANENTPWVSDINSYRVEVNGNELSVEI